MITSAPRTTSAPGKMVISGEYAVLEGARALSVAINRRVECQFTPGNTVKLEGMGTGPYDAYIKGHNLIIHGPHAKRFSLPQRIFEYALSVGKNIPTGHYRLNSNALYDFNQTFPRKLGFGSSGALTSALCAHLFPQTATPYEIFEFGLNAYRHFSNKKGSGVDIATSCSGGLISYRLNSEHPEISHQTIPAAVKNLLVVDTGTSQNTRRFLSNVSALKSKNHTLYQRVMSNCIDHAEELAHRLLSQQETKQLELLIDAINRNNLALHALQDAAGIPIFSKDIQQIIRIAKIHGGTAKPSGAGGGDLVLACIPENAKKAFDAEIRSYHFGVFPMDIADQGVILNG